MSLGISPSRWLDGWENQWHAMLPSEDIPINIIPTCKLNGTRMSVIVHSILRCSVVLMSGSGSLEARKGHFKFAQLLQVVTKGPATYELSDGKVWNAIHLSPATPPTPDTHTQCLCASLRMFTCTLQPLIQPRLLEHLLCSSGFAGRFYNCWETITPELCFFSKGQDCVVNGLL